MIKIKNAFLKLSTTQKIFFSLSLLVLIFSLSALIPTLSKLISGTRGSTKVIWDGTIASSFNSGSGTKSDPYVITDGSELAFLSLKLEDTSYNNNYFIITDNINLNEGIFKYENDDIIYILNDEVFYVDKYTNKYYETNDFSDPSIGTVNIFPSLENFEGTINGNLNTIYGMYITGEEETALFKNLSGSVEGLIFKNSLVYGGSVTSGLVTKAENSIIKDIIFDGYVISDSDRENTITSMFTIDDFYVSEIERNIDFDNEYFNSLDIISSEISGEYFSIDNIDLTINDEEVLTPAFNINLGTQVPDVINIKASSTNEEASLEFFDMQIKVVYKDDISSGIVGSANNTLISNVVNKGSIIGSNLASGILGKVEGPVTINNSYNEGLIESSGSSSGLIGFIENTTDIITINNSYNSGNLLGKTSGGIVSVINDSFGEVDIKNSFNITGSPLGLVKGSFVNVNNSYSVIYDDDFIVKDLDYFYNKDNLINDLKFKEYLEEDIESGFIWIYDYENFPKLYFDLDEEINLHVGPFVFKEFYIPNNKYINYPTGFTVDIVNDFSLVDNVSYYLSSDNLTKEELNNISEWEDLNSLIQITEEGSYIIYIKILDYQGRVTYLNSDKITIDFTKPDASIVLNEEIWNTLNEDLNVFYINNDENFKVKVNDEISGIKEVKYHITNNVLTENELNNLEVWTTHENGIMIDTPGKHVIYVKVLDRAGNITYVNTDFIYYNGFIVTARPGIKNNYQFTDIINITSNSSATFNFNYSGEYLPGFENYNRFLKTSEILPSNTNIKLIDNSNNKIYQYITTSDDYDYTCDEECFATYPFTLFKELGVKEDSYYENQITINEDLVIEDFTVIFEFNTSDDINDLKILFELNNNENTISTLNNDDKLINIFTHKYLDVDVSHNYEGESLIYGVNSNLNIIINSKINYKKDNDNIIYDTSKDDLKLGLKISLVDEENNRVHRKFLKDLIIKVNNEDYIFESDNYIKVPLDYLTSEQDISLEIITNDNVSLLIDGTYYLKVEYIAAFDGIYSEKLNGDITNIPVLSSGHVEKNDYFNIDIDNNVNILYKESDNNYYDLEITKSNGSKVLVSLYEKENLSAYDQSYKLVDLNNYLYEELVLEDNKKYILGSIDEEIINVALNFDVDKFEYTGYKLVFELFDENKKMSQITKHFIIRGGLS